MGRRQREIANVLNLGGRGIGSSILAKGANMREVKNMNDAGGEDADAGDAQAREAYDARFLSTILALPPFDRFVYTLTYIEGCTDDECSNLLQVPSNVIQEARRRALRKVENSELVMNSSEDS